MSVAKQVITTLARKAGINIDEDIEIHDERFYDRILEGGSLALGESYMEGWWDPVTLSLDQLSEMVSKAKLGDQLREISWSLKLKMGLAWAYRKLFPVYSIDQAKVVALQHYDLGNELYEEMLEIMVYSCAYFRSRQDTLRQAQINKMELINRKLYLKPGNLVLDIGCGWGELARYLTSQNADLIVD